MHIYTSKLNEDETEDVQGLDNKKTLKKPPFLLQTMNLCQTGRQVSTLLVTLEKSK